MGRPRVSVMERIEAKLDRSGECWLWTGKVKPNGYVQVLVWENGKKFYRGIHRVMYEALVGPIPDGLVIDHLCRVRHCCNPAHLEPVTQEENVRRGLYGMQQTCREGHRFDEVRWDGRRGCSECRRARGRRSYHKRKAERAA